MQTAPITSFRGGNAFLSNFYRQGFYYLGTWYPTAEHAYQWQKPTCDYDRLMVLQAETPGQAKKIANSLPRREDWDTAKLDIMLGVLRAKFTRFMPLGTMRNPLSIRLIQTGDREIIEGNTWGDTFWGQCPLGVGENMLGKLLMKVRSEIKHGI